MMCRASCVFLMLFLDAHRLAQGAAQGGQLVNMPEVDSRMEKLEQIADIAGLVGAPSALYVASPTIVTTRASHGLCQRRNLRRHPRRYPQRLMPAVGR